jgi:hypothetical protein
MLAVSKFENSTDAQYGICGWVNILGRKFHNRLIISLRIKNNLEN